jgi:hypothetical protein
MNSIAVGYFGPFELTFWGNGVSAKLWRDGRSIFWQGEEAREIVDRFGADGITALHDIWDEYVSLAQPD